MIYKILALLLIFVFGNSKSLMAIENCENSCKENINKLEKYARAGSPEAQTIIALSYKTGEFTEVDPTKSWKWIMPAVRMRYAPALHTASTWFRNGFGYKTQNLERANELLSKAVEKGFPPAIYDSAILNYRSGNITIAKKQLEEAAQLGHKTSARLLSKLVSSDLVDNVIDKTEFNVENKLIIRKTDMEVEEMLAGLVELLASKYGRAQGTGSRLGYRNCEDSVGCQVIFDRDNIGTTVY